MEAVQRVRRKTRCRERMAPGAWTGIGTSTPPCHFVFLLVPLGVFYAVAVFPCVFRLASASSCCFHFNVPLNAAYVDQVIFCHVLQGKTAITIFLACILFHFLVRGDGQATVSTHPPAAEDRELTYSYLFWLRLDLPEVPCQLFLLTSGTHIKLYSAIVA